MKIYQDGWVLLGHHATLLPAFWRDGFPIVQGQDSGRYGQYRRDSPIYTYDDGGIGAVQWLNVTRNVSAVLKSDGSWKTGGQFHLWVSPGAGTRPYEVPLPYPIRIERGDPSDWQTRKQEAVEAAEEILGLCDHGTHAE